MPNPDGPEGQAAQSAPSTDETHHDRVQRHIGQAKTELRDGDKPRIVAIEPIRKYFEYSHLPPRLQAISAPFGDLADRILELPASAERSVALRKLLESKDAAVRAALPG